LWHRRDTDQIEYPPWTTIFVTKKRFDRTPAGVALLKAHEALFAIEY